MKAAAIKKVIMDRKYAMIWVDQDGNQWVGDGRYFYVADDCVQLNERNLLTVLDVDKDKRDSIVCKMGPCYDERLSILPNEEQDVQLIPHISVSYGGELITLMVSTDGELVGIRQSAIKPADSKMGLAFFLRRREGMHPWIMCFEGMMATAALMIEPAEVIQSIMDSARTMQQAKVVDYMGLAKEAEEDEE